MTRDSGSRRLVGSAGRQLGANGSNVLVEIGGSGQVTRADAIQDCLPYLVGQPEGDSRQRDRKL